MVDEILATSPEERKNKPTYLKYVRNPCSSKPNDSEFSSYQCNNKNVNQTEVRDLEAKPKKVNISILDKYKRANTTHDNVMESQEKVKIDDSILQAYQMINNKRNYKPSNIKPTYKVGGAGRQDAASRRKNVRKFTADDEDTGLVSKKHNNKPPRAGVCLPIPKEVHKKSDKDLSNSSSSKNHSCKSAKSLKDMLSPTNASHKVQFKEPSSASKVLDKGKSGVQPAVGQRKSKMRDLEDKVNNITIELSTLICSTKESDNGSGNKLSAAVHPSGMPKRSRTDRAMDRAKSGDKKQQVKLVPASQTEQEYFEYDANEQEIDEALNFADDTFDIDDDATPTALSTVQRDPSACSNFSLGEDFNERKAITEEIDKIKEEIKERWDILYTFADTPTAKKCFEFLKTNITDVNDCGDAAKMEQVHKYIKQQGIPNYRAMGFECFRLLNCYTNLEEQEDNLIEYDN